MTLHGYTHPLALLVFSPFAVLLLLNIFAADHTPQRRAILGLMSFAWASAYVAAFFAYAFHGRGPLLSTVLVILALIPLITWTMWLDAGKPRD